MTTTPARSSSSDLLAAFAEHQGVLGGQPAFQRDRLAAAGALLGAHPDLDRWMATAVEARLAGCAHLIWPHLGGPRSCEQVGPVRVDIPTGVVSASATTRSAPRPAPRGELQRMARDAAKRRRHLLVWVDEAQNTTPAEIATLAAVMQELANVQRLPVAVWAAGLPVARQRWIDASSPLKRQRFTTLDSLNAADTAAAFAIPIREAGRHIDDDDLLRSRCSRRSSMRRRLGRGEL